jgi:hypothetical protein
LFCGSNKVIKKGVRNGITRYLCNSCGKSHSSTRRTTKQKEKLWEQYVWEKQTRTQLANKQEVSTKTIARVLDSVEVIPKIHNPRKVTAVFDATYFGRRNGILVVRDPNKKENLHAHSIVSETKLEYRKARDELTSLGYDIQAVVLDGKRGIPSVFKDIPVQICQFHQWQIVKRKMTTKPKLPSHQALLSIGRKISKVTEPEMKNLLENFEKVFHNELHEKTHILGTKRSRYTHAKLRSAYQSLVRNLPYLYTYQRYPELKIPNTTNSLDGSFNILKMMVNIHRGLRPERRMKVIRELLKC